MCIYTAPLVDNTCNDIFDKVPKAMIDCYPWDDNGYKPISYGQVCYSDLALYIRLTTFEDNPKTIYHEANDPVYKDSCLEFFINPLPNQNTFCDFEFNSNGTMLLGFYKDGNFKLLAPSYQKQFAVKSYKNIQGEPFWCVDFTVPFQFLQEIFVGYEPKESKNLTVNFYKCGDETPNPHYGCWSKVFDEKPNFFHPEDFGILKLVNNKSEKGEDNA